MKISVVTVVYNNAKTVEEAILSVLEQTYKNIEYIVIDGGSTDGTLEILHKYKGKIAILVSEKDNGIYDAMNKGVKLATGDLIYFLNSDDKFYDKTVVEDVVKVAEQNKHIDFFYGGVVCKNIFRGESENVFLKRISDFKIKLGQNIKQQSLFACRTAFTQVGLFVPKYKVSADYEWECRLVKANKKGLFVRRIIAVYAQTGFSSKGSWSQYIEKYNIIRMHFGLLYGVTFYLRSIFKYLIVLILKKMKLASFVSKIANKIRRTSLKN